MGSILEKSSNSKDLTKTYPLTLPIFWLCFLDVGFLLGGLLPL